MMHYAMGLAALGMVVVSMNSDFNLKAFVLWILGILFMISTGVDYVSLYRLLGAD